MVIAINPLSKESKHKSGSRFGADIAIVSVNHPDFNGTDQLTYGERVPFVVNGPGSYEVKEIFIHGKASKAEIDGKKYINTIYNIN